MDLARQNPSSMRASIALFAEQHKEQFKAKLHMFHNIEEQCRSPPFERKSKKPPALLPKPQLRKRSSSLSAIDAFQASDPDDAPTRMRLSSATEGGHDQDSLECLPDTDVNLENETDPKAVKTKTAKDSGVTDEDARDSSTSSEGTPTITYASKFTNVVQTGGKNFLLQDLPNVENGPPTKPKTLAAYEIASVGISRRGNGGDDTTTNEADDYYIDMDTSSAKLKVVPVGGSPIGHKIPLPKRVLPTPPTADSPNVEGENFAGEMEDYYDDIAKATDTNSTDVTDTPPHVTDTPPYSGDNDDLYLERIGTDSPPNEDENYYDDLSIEVPPVHGKFVHPVTDNPDVLSEDERADAGVVGDLADPYGDNGEGFYEVIDFKPNPSTKGTTEHCSQMYIM